MLSRFILSTLVSSRFLLFWINWVIIQSIYKVLYKENSAEKPNTRQQTEQVCFKAHGKASTDSDSLRYAGRSFQSFGAAAKKDESPTCSLECGMKSRLVSYENLSRYLRSVYLSLCIETKSTKYGGAAPIMHLKTYRMILNTILSLMGSQ